MSSLFIREYKRTHNAFYLVMGGLFLIGVMILIIPLIFAPFFPRASKTSAPIGGEVEILLYQVPQEQEVTIKSF